MNVQNFWHMTSWLLLKSVEWIIQQFNLECVSGHFVKKKKYWVLNLIPAVFQWKQKVYL